MSEVTIIASDIPDLSVARVKSKFGQLFPRVLHLHNIILKTFF